MNIHEALTERPITGVQRQDRKSVGEGTSVKISGHLGGRRVKNKKREKLKKKI